MYAKFENTENKEKNNKNKILVSRCDFYYFVLSILYKLYIVASKHLRYNSSYSCLGLF